MKILQIYWWPTFPAGSPRWCSSDSMNKSWDNMNKVEFSCIVKEISKEIVGTGKNKLLGHSQLSFFNMYVK